LLERQAPLPVGNARAGNEGAYLMANNQQPNQEREQRQAQPGQERRDDDRRQDQDMERPNQERGDRKDQETPR